MAPTSPSAATPTPAPTPVAPEATGTLEAAAKDAGSRKAEPIGNPEALTVDGRSPISKAEYARRWHEAQRARKLTERFGEGVSEADVCNLLKTTVATSPRPLTPSEVAAAFERETGWTMTAHEVGHRLRGVERDALRRYVPTSWHRMDLDEKQRALDEAGQN